MCVRSEGASPIYTRTSSSPSLNEIDSHPLEMNTNHSNTDKQLSVESSGSESCLVKDRPGCVISEDVEVGGAECVTSEGMGGADEDEVVQFCVGDVRKRLSQHSMAPKRTYQRDPEDPSGDLPQHCTCTFTMCGILYIQSCL